jgi:hypothetical protein
MRSALRLFPLAAITVAVGLSLAAKRNPARLRQFSVECLPAIPEIDEPISTIAPADNDDEVDIAAPGHVVETTDIDQTGNRSVVARSNQQAAIEVARALKHAKLLDYEIDITVNEGAITLDGEVANPEQRKAAELAATSVRKSMRVINRLVTSAESELVNVLRKGMTVEEALAALNATHMDETCPGPGWTQFWCTSRRFPAKSISMTFDHEVSNTLRLTRWYLTEGR